MNTEPNSKPLSMCLSRVSWSKTVPASKPGESYEVTYGHLPPDPLRELPERTGFACTCPAFKFRKDHGAFCKHIQLVKDQWCGWEEKPDWGEVVEGKCPCCGGPVVEATE